MRKKESPIECKLSRRCNDDLKNRDKGVAPLDRAGSKRSEKHGDRISFSPENVGACAPEVTISAKQRSFFRESEKGRVKSTPY